MRKVILDQEYLKKEYEDGKSTIVLSKELNVSRHIITANLREAGVKLKSRGEYTEPIVIGQRFNKLVVIEDIKTKQDKRTRYLVQCDCGRKAKTYGTSLKKGQVACWHCRNETMHKVKWTGCGDISTERWNSLKYKAKRRKIEFNISIEYAWDLFIKQNKKCKFTNFDLVFVTYGGHKLPTASLDRIDSSKGYVEGNVQWVHKRINVMKNNLSDKEFIGLCKIVAENGIKK